MALSEDGPTSGELEVRRSNGLSGMVVVSWVAHSEAVDVSRILVNTGGTITFDDNSATPNTNIVLQLKPDGVCYYVQYSSGQMGYVYTCSTVQARWGMYISMCSM